MKNSGYLLAGTDSLGRIIPENIPKRDGKTVGIFYFIGSGGNAACPIYDISEVLKRDPLAYESVERWKAAGGPYNEGAFWGKPLFGYYSSQDKWVISRHAVMLADIGVDYILIDYTNAAWCLDTLEILLEVFKEFKDKGVDVPKVAFYTNTNSGKNANIIYKDVYLKHKDRFSDLWFLWDGKPLLIADKNDPELLPEIPDYFTLKDPIWPTEREYKENAWPWMEFGRLYTPESVYGRNGRREVMSVSAAQHCDTVMFSETAWYGGNDRTRSWHGGKNDKSEGAVLYGYNFTEQWEWALQNDPESVFVTGFNEWSAVVTHFRDGLGPIQMCDNADINCSRDVEPMYEGYGDNYLMQLAAYIRKFKGCDDLCRAGRDITVDINAGPAAFDNVGNIYTHVPCISERDHAGWGVYYKYNNMRNRISEIRIAKDKENVYFLIKTENELTKPSDNWMTVFIDSGKAGGIGKCWDITVNRLKPEKNMTAIECHDICGSRITGYADISIGKKHICIKAPRALINGIENPCDFRFKVADNYIDGDVTSFYTHGDCAPYGRLNFVFTE